MSKLLDLPLWVKAVIALAVLSSLYGGYRVWKHSIWKDGWNDALAAVEKQNEHAREIAQGVRSKLRQCESGGGSWDVSTGTCDR